MNDKLNIGVIGTGMIGQDHIRRISEVLAGGRISAVTDIDLRLANEIGAARGAEVFASGTELIESDLVDAVMVTSYGPAHEEAVLAAIRVGKPVFCEKPLSPEAAGCERIMEAEMAAGKRLVQVGFMRRYDASYRAMKETLDSNQLGEALLVHCAHRNATVNDYYVASMAITDTAIHEVDTMRWLLGEEIVSVRVDRGKKTRNAADHLIDPITLVMETESGVRIDDEIFVNCRFGYDIRCEVVAEDGTIALSDQNVISTRSAQGRQSRITVDWRERFLGAYDTEIQEWIRSVRAGDITGPSSWDGYAAAVVCDAGVKALDTDGDRVDVVMREKPEFYR